MPHCQMLHSNLAVAWNLNGGNSLTVELIANIDVTDYVAFGFSKKGASKMVKLTTYFHEFSEHQSTNFLF